MKREMFRGEERNIFVIQVFNNERVKPTGKARQYFERRIRLKTQQLIRLLKIFPRKWFISFSEDSLDFFCDEFLRSSRGH